MRVMVIQILIFLLAGSVSFAQEKKAPPHNGQLKKAGYYYVEVVDCSGYLEIYLYDLDMYPKSNYGLSGVVKFYYPDSTHSTIPMYSYGMDGFTAEASKESYSRCELFIRGQGIAIQVAFKDLVCLRPEE